MRLDSLVRLIEAADFMSFRELALHCLALKGYKGVTLTDGWNDGGTDVRVFQLPPNPSGIAFQITVEHDWKRKLHDDAAKVKEKLGLQQMTLVTSRRIAEAKFFTESEAVWKDHSVRVTKLDSQAMASTFFAEGQTALALRVLGIDVGQDAASAGLSAVASAAYSFAFFSQPARDFRESAIESAITAVAAQHRSIPRQTLERDVKTLLSLPEAQAPNVTAAVDRMIQERSLAGPAANLTLSTQLADAASGMATLRNREWEQLQRDVSALLAEFGVHAKKAQLDEIASDLGALLLDVARNAVDALKSKEPSFQTRAANRLRHLHATLDSVGVPEGDLRDVFRERLADIAGNSGIGKALLAGELFLALAPLGLPHLIRALGARNEIRTILDASVAIPMLTALLFSPVNNRFSLAAHHAYSRLQSLGMDIALPVDYLEEAAAHLIRAYHDYVGIVDVDQDLTSSENSFVAHYASCRKAGEEITFVEFVEAFGLDSSLRNADFYVARDALKPRLQRLFARYSIRVLPLRHPTAAAQRRAEEAIAYAVDSLGVKRPDVLAQHDARTLAYLFDSDRFVETAFVLCTWDGLHFKAREREATEWLALNPAVLGDILTMAAADDSGAIASPVVLAKALSEEAASRGARVWDQIASFERGSLTDARLISVAREFKDQYVQKAQGDTQSEAIRKEWASWKARHYTRPEAEAEAGQPERS
jgi:hypothetical protein